MLPQANRANHQGLVPTPPPLRPTVGCQRCRPQDSMGAKGTRRSMGTKAAQRKILSTLHPSTIPKPKPDPSIHPYPQPTPNPTPNPLTLAVARLD